MSMDAARIFERLRGVWVLRRDIPGQGRVEGSVEFSSLGEGRLLYAEKGLFYRETGDVLEAWRTYVYELRGAAIHILYDDPERKGELLHELVFDGNSAARHTHQCGSDRYALAFSLNGDTVTMEYRVYGAHKDYEMRSVLTPAPISSD